MDINQQIRDYIAKNLLFSDNGFQFKDDDSFLNEGIVDSVGVMELISFVDSQYGLKVDPSEVSPENFDSVNKLAAFIRRKQSVAEAA
jgi:acyl carrier protein